MDPVRRITINSMFVFVKQSHAGTLRKFNFLFHSAKDFIFPLRPLIALGKVIAENTNILDAKNTTKMNLKLMVKNIMLKSLKKILLKKYFGDVYP